MDDITTYIIKQTICYRGEIMEIETEPRPTREEAEALFTQCVEQAKMAIDHAHETAEAMVEARGQPRH